jgi:hypothetical protein
MSTRRRQIILVLASFAIGIAITILAPWTLRRLGGIIFPIPRQEVARVTSPDGTVDAVMVVLGCGPTCSDTYLATVVPKGAKAPVEIQQFNFSADDLTDAHLQWQQPHLVEIAYNRALINQFRNISYPFAKFGAPETWDYKVEIRLAPASTGFSYLKPAK